MKIYVNWREFSILFVLSVISLFCVFPYVLTLYRDTFNNSGYPIGLILFYQLIQGLILFSIAIFLGLFFTGKINFQLPLIRTILSKGDYKSIFKNTLGISVSLGVVVAIIIYILDIYFTWLGVKISTHQNPAPVWQTLLASVYGGVAEEILLRLFLMTSFIWGGMKIFREDQPSKVVIIVSIILVAIIFGLGHLPVTATLTELNNLVILRAIVLNGLGGIVFGSLFWLKGFESAMIAHFTTDIFLLTLLPLLFT